MPLGIAHRLNGVRAGTSGQIDRLNFGFFGALSTLGQPQYIFGPQTVSLAGTSYGIDTNFEPYRREAFRHRSVPSLRESLNYDNIPGEGVVNTAGNWRREMVDYSLGAGQLYLDHKKSVDNRFYVSKGVNPWTQWELSLQNATTLTLGMQGSRTNVKPLAVGKYQYFLEDDKISFIDTTVGYGTVKTVASPPSTGTGHYFTDITSNGEFVFVACGTNGIYYWPVGDSSTSGTHYVTQATGSPASGALGYTIDKVAWVADALWASGEQYLYVFGASTAVPTGNNAINGITTAWTSGNPITSSQQLPQVVGANWRWTNIVEGNSQIYIGGYNSIGGVQTDGAVYRVSQVLSQNLANSTYSTTTTFAAPVKSLQLPTGEYPTCLFSYLNYVFVGTSAGVRMCETLNIYDPTATGTGDLKSGTILPNILQPVTSPVTSFTADGRWIWFAWCNYDSTSTGLGRMDITQFIDDLTPAYASDLMVTAQAVTLNLAWDVIQQAPLVCVSGATSGTNGTYSQDPANLVTSGYVNSGWVTYGIPDDKMVTSFHPDVYTSAGSVTVALMADKGNAIVTPFNTIIEDTANANTLGSKTYLNPMIQGVQFQVQVTLGRQSGALGPVLSRWTMEAFPQVASETTITPVLQLFRNVLVGGQEVAYDPYFEYHRLDVLRRSQSPVSYVEGPLSATVLIAGIDWLPENLQPPQFKGYNALAVVTLTTLNGFVYSPIPTH